MQMSSWPHVHTAEPSHLKTDSNAHTASKYDFVKVCMSVDGAGALQGMV